MYPRSQGDQIRGGEKSTPVYVIDIHLKYGPGGFQGTLPEREHANGHIFQLNGIDRGSFMVLTAMLAEDGQACQDHQPPCNRRPFAHLAIYSEISYVIWCPEHNKPMEPYLFFRIQNNPI
jgi:hypothetical protein